MYIPSFVSRLASAAIVAVLVGACSDSTSTPKPSIGVSVQTLSVTQGTTGTTSVTIQRNNGYNAAVDLTLEGAPAEVSGVFSPSRVTNPGTASSLAVTVGSSVAPQTYSLTVRAKGTGVSDSTATLSLTVTPAPSFTLTVPSGTTNLAQGGTSQAIITINRDAGFAGGVALTASDLPQGVTASFDPSPATGTSSTLTLTATATATTGNATVTIHGQAPGLPAKTVTLPIAVVATAQYALTLNQAALGVVQNGNGQTVITITRNAGFTGAVALTVEGVPTGVTTTLNPVSPVSASQTTLTVATDFSAAVGNAPLTIRGQVNGQPDITTPLALSIAPATTPPVTVQVGSSALTMSATGQVTTTIDVTKLPGFSGVVTLGTSNLPAGVTASFNPTSLAPRRAPGAKGSAQARVSSTVTLTASNGTPGTFSFNITATGQGFPEADTPIQLTVLNPSTGSIVFSFSCSAANTIPVWFAKQDGGGAWSQVAVGANNTWSFDLSSGKGGVAWVSPNGAGGYQLTVYFATQSEMTSIGTTQCGSFGTKSVNGSIIGLTTSQIAQISLGRAPTTVLGGGAGTFQLTGILDGSRDLIAARSTIISATLVFDKLILRRGLNIANNGTLAPIDFNALEAFDPDTKNLTVTGAGTDLVSAISSYTTANGALTVLSTSLPSTTLPTTYSGVPSSQGATGDLHSLSAVATDAGATAIRTSTLYFRDAVDQILALGPAPAATVTVAASTPYARIQAAWSIQSQYNKFFALSGTQASGGPHAFTVAATPAYFGPTTHITIGVPNFSAVSGWQDIYGPVAGSPVIWGVFTSGWNLSGGGVGAPVAEGSQSLSALQRGSITP